MFSFVLKFSILARFLAKFWIGSLQPEDVERLCFAFVLYCVAKLKGKGMKEESSRVRLWKILEGCKLKCVMSVMMVVILV
jgi:hypothetical protein